MANKEVKEIREIEVLEGTVTSAFPPTRMEDGNYRPANILITTDGDESEQVRISQFPNSNFDTKVFYEPIQMPTWYEALPENIRDLVDSRVQVIASPKGEWNGVRQFNYVQSFKVLKLAHEPQPRTAQPQTAKPSTADENQMRIMRQSTLGYSATLLAGKEFATPQLMVERTIQVASKLLEYVISGEMPSFVDEPAEEAEDDEQPDEQQPAEGAVFDLFGNADDGVLPVE